MHNSLEHLPGSKREQLRAITKVIIQSVRPEKIILFGTHGLAGAGPDPTDPASLIIPFVFDLLIVTRRGERRYDHELQDIIENRCRTLTPVNIIVHDIDHVNYRLSEGHYFFSLMIREAILLYDAGIVILATPKPPDLPGIRIAAQQDYEKWAPRARAFFKSALMNVGDGEWRVAVFLLHQAAEHIYQAILLAFMGYKPCTHNLDKLRRQTSRLSIELALLFPRDSDKEDHLFRLLLQAYVDARYKDDYQITADEVELLADRVGQLLSIAERVCRNRFTSLEKMAAG